ncbi:hypothetical protein F442_04355 [Phytophthora nicotianae P10297]|uniref:Uncharacterized protein n=4 Tax=Phytophthora nicotianae TaxID=4792 RepID=V9FAR0_PHYNI|nr:hypothetical protein F443_07763 [Phytophthora nicotianae P1569]ETI48216.1 hypothetical protein F443_07759 [Phytophthora nicotianae P1569]ETL94675.1 hypothetical protein L917_07419 [Phytophthora nicotianae]ETO76954.1 hypothetical protein F444_07826 [Phytophthora nicotianae P1976]ETP50437.1 hypothetical protein F442_04355 [Phytophthora nicotianae P10297]
MRVAVSREPSLSKDHGGWAPKDVRVVHGMRAHVSQPAIRRIMLIMLPKPPRGHEYLRASHMY